MTGAWWVGESELDDDQKQVIQLPLTGRFFVTGPAGSGKTNMLLLRANYLYKAGLANLGVLVFTRSLKGFLHSGSAQYAFPKERVYTFISFLVRFLADHNVKYEPSGNFDRDRQYLTEEAIKILDSRSIPVPYDALLVDEAQDYLPHEMDLLGRLAPNLFFVADANQKIYGGADGLSKIASMVSRRLSLRFHYRNGRKICTLADELMKAVDGYVPCTGSSQYDEGRRPSSVEFFQRLSLSQQAAQAIKSLETQLSSYPGESLAVMCPRREELAATIELLRQSAISGKCTFASSDTEMEFIEDKPIIVCTAHAAKGLEFTCVHILGAEFFAKFRDRQKRLAYTSVTRAKTSLRIYNENTLPGSLDAARAALAGPPQVPTLKSIFG